MEFMDEAILQLKSVQKEQEKRNRCSGDQICIQGKGRKLVELSFCSELFSMKIPETFIPLPRELADRKYLMKDRPQVIWSNPEGSVNLTFRSVEVLIKEEDTKVALEEMRGAIKNLNPAAVFFHKEIQEVITHEKERIGWFDYKNYALDSKVYHLLFLVPFLSGTVLGSFNCPFSEWQDWKGAALKMLQTFKKRERSESPEGKV